MNHTQRTVEELRGSDRAAALLLTLPPTDAATILRCLSDNHVEKITAKMLIHQHVTQEAQDNVLREAYELLLGEQYLATGGVEYARALLSEAFGAERAEDMVARLVAAMQSRPFSYLQNVEATQIATFVHDEHPQTVALILSYLTPIHAAAILRLLPPDMQLQVTMRVAQIDAINPAVVKEVQNGLRKKLASVLNTDISKTGGLEFLVHVLTQVDRSTERTILEQLEETAPELASEIKKKMFVFDDLKLLDDRSIQRVLRDIDSRDLALALRGATTAVRELILRNVSSRAAETLREELDTGAPVRVRTIEDAQQRIVAVVRTLEDSEEISVARGGPGGDRML